MPHPIYLDYNATTPLDPQVLECFTRSLKEIFGNPASLTHKQGWVAEYKLNEARETVAALIGAASENIVFNSGASEANNTLFKAFAQSYLKEGCHIITTLIEHKCILKCTKTLEKLGCTFSYLPVDSCGVVKISELRRLITPQTRLISVMAANNETGVIQPFEKAAEIAQEHGIPFHTDAAQWIGKLPFDIGTYPIDYLSFSAHKFYGPKGVGALFAKDFSLIESFPLIEGGGQENGIRSGTVNLPSILAFAEASQLAKKLLPTETEKLSIMKQDLVESLQHFFPNVIFNGNPKTTLPGVLNFSIPGVLSKDLLAATKREIALSTGSACTTVNRKPSHVLKAMGLSDEACRSSLRLSFGRFTTQEELKQAIEVIKIATDRLLQQPLSSSI